MGLLVTSNRFRPPAILAKIAATADEIIAKPASRPSWRQERDAATATVV